MPPKFYFGKYKDTLISDCKDLNYLVWVFENTGIKANIKNAVSEQITKLKSLK